MLWLRKFLLWIRNKEREDAKKLYVQSLLGLLGFAVVSVVVDFFLPFEDYWIFVRSIFLIPIGLGAFVPLYTLALQRGRFLALEDRDHVPYRLRWSSKWRRNLSLIVGAIIVVIVYALDYFIGYTIMASLVVTAVVGMLAFCRMTQREAKRLELNIPDPRDTQFEARLEQQRAERERRLREQEESDEEDQEQETADAEGNRLS